MATEREATGREETPREERSHFLQLLAIGLINLAALLGIVSVFREMRQGHFDEAELERQLDSRGFLNRILGRVTRAVTKPWHLYPTGFLFGLDLADSLIRSGKYARILLVGADVHTPFMPWENAWQNVMGGAQRPITPEEYAAGHLPGAVNIPHDQLAARLGELSGAREHDVVVYCRTGRRSAEALGVLDEAGFKRLFHLKGDYTRWTGEKRPVIATQ